ncbi:major facilitator superfamily domain-containing protein [Microdochium trichocladiopsis]|uniref:Major facilitator superfamily domain-containing protein n=1 Tax=Microdochium trichocladiopsis TaxID=1682393 RepID=A0A9P8Y373_9PEZI|nr:major facilitator superfamily domain-containing protein [Microdochium trichocladiopsis]KAH7026333.1 major facilitator superfamily domain-containing protein [Microdochium trichocladiopsis]
MTTPTYRLENGLEDTAIQEDHTGLKSGDSAARFEENTTAEKKLVRKIDLYLMPSIWFLYLLAYMDRSNIGNARVAGMSRDLGLSDTDYSLAINLFQVSYVVFSVPSNMILARTKASYYMSAIMGLWGIVVAAMAAARTPAQLWGLRFALGTLEAGFSPAVFYVYSVWYRRHEQSRRFMVFWSAGILSGAFAGILAGLIASGLDGAHGLAGWRWLFLVEGVITVGVAFLSPLVLLDQPEQCNKFTAEERALAVRRLDADGFDTGTSPGRDEPRRKVVTLPKALWAALTTPAFWIIFIAFMMFYPTLVEGLGYDSVTAQFMTAPLYVVAVPFAVALSYLADRRPHWRGAYLSATLLAGALLSAVAAAAAAVVGSLVARYVLMCLLNCAMYSAVPLALSFATTELGAVEPATRAVALAVMSGLGNLAQIYSSYLWPAADAPQYVKGFATYAALLALGAGLYVLGWCLFRKAPLKARV